MIAAKTLTLDRKSSANLLAERLHRFSATDVVLVGICGGGEIIGAQLASILKAPLQIMSCKQFVHPSNKNLVIGSATERDVVLGDAKSGLPQDFIAHQIVLLKQAARFEREQYGAEPLSPFIAGKPVILITEMIADAHSILAAIESIKKLAPSKLIVASVLVSRPAVKIISNAVDELIYLDSNSDSFNFQSEKISDLDRALVRNHTNF